jgi:hypothetical protein
MRDPDRIPAFTTRLAEIWAHYPDMRFGQLLMNAGLDENKSVFWLREENATLDKLENWHQHMQADRR